MKPYNNKVDITVQFKPGELQKLLKAKELEKYLLDSFYRKRNGRYCFWSRQKWDCKDIDS